MSESDRRLRERLYSQYVSSGQARVPASLAELAPRAPYLRRVVASYFPADRDAVIFELGCGHGALLHFAREAGYRRITGVDGSQEQVAAATRLEIEGAERGDLLAALGARESGSQDAVVALDVLEHFRGDELVAVVDEVWRVLRAGGRFLIHVPNAESPFFGAIRYGDLTHCLAFTSQSLTQLLVASRFARVECTEDVPIVHGLASGVRRVAWALLRLGLRFFVAAETGDTGRRAIFSRNLFAVAFK